MSARGHVPALSFRELVRNWLDTEAQLRIVAVRKDSQLHGLVFGAMVEGSAVAHNGAHRLRGRIPSEAEPVDFLGCKGVVESHMAGPWSRWARLVVK